MLETITCRTHQSFSSDTVGSTFALVAPSFSSPTNSSHPRSCAVTDGSITTLLYKHYISLN